MASVWRGRRHITQCIEGPGARAGRVIPGLPEFSLEEVEQHRTQETGIWVVYGDAVYDITEYAALHPGGREKILLAAGRALEPYWEVFPQHQQTSVYEELERRRLGNICADERGWWQRREKKEGLYAHDPPRSAILKVNTQEPFNAETPMLLLTQSFLTPNNLFFVRNHLPVPTVDPESYVLQVQVEGMTPVRLTLDELRSKFPHHTVMATLQCAGNRRADLAAVKPVRGLCWTGGAMGNAKWSGVRLRDVLVYAGVEKAEHLQHVHLEGLDTNPLTGEHYGASIPIEKALDARGDCLLALEMNGEELPRDHGYPVRAVVPGTVGARNVKWLAQVVASREEYGGQWQQRDYKGFCPSVNWDTVDFSSAPAIQELPIQSLITSPVEGAKVDRGGEVEVTGVAWSGGGRRVVRVDVSVDDGKNWQAAELGEGAGQPRGQAWAWTMWSALLPLPPGHSGPLRVCCKAVDSSYNVQPDTSDPIWNLRGCLSNAWHRVTVTVAED